VGCLAIPCHLSHAQQLTDLQQVFSSCQLWSFRHTLNGVPVRWGLAWPSSTQGLGLWFRVVGLTLNPQTMTKCCPPSTCRQQVYTQAITCMCGAAYVSCFEIGRSSERRHSLSCSSHMFMPTSSGPTVLVTLSVTVCGTPCMDSAFSA
jgi:hypothetical protein